MENEIEPPASPAIGARFYQHINDDVKDWVYTGEKWQEVKKACPHCGEEI